MTYNVSDLQAIGALDTELPLVAPEGEAAQKIEGKSPWRLAIQRLRHDRAAVLSFTVIVIIVLVAIFAPVIAWVTGHGVYQQFRGPAPPIGLGPTGAPVGPSSTFLLGTDDQGRDILVRIAYGARISLFVGLVATGITVITGTVVGLAAGYLGKIVDTTLARLMDWLVQAPFLPFAVSAGYFGKIVDTTLARLMDWLLAIPFLLFAISLDSVVDVHGTPDTTTQIAVVIVVLGFLTRSEEH